MSGETGAKGRTIRVFLADGAPSGILTAEIMNWTGKVVVAPRTRLPDLLARPEAGRTGVYFLTGPDPEDATRTKIYVGESDSVRDRLLLHNSDDTKDFFTRVCIVVSKDENLTKTHARYLESRLIGLIKAAKRAKLTNVTAPMFDLLPESDRADMEFFYRADGRDPAGTRVRFHPSSSHPSRQCQANREQSANSI
jgi:predicted GIY-YIG superfamily endonuclease